MLEIINMSALFNQAGFVNDQFIMDMRKARKLIMNGSVMIPKIILCTTIHFIIVFSWTSLSIKE